MAGFLSAVMAAGATSQSAFAGGSQLSAVAREKYSVTAGLSGAMRLDVQSIFQGLVRAGNMAGNGSVAATSKQVYFPLVAFQSAGTLVGPNPYAIYSKSAVLSSYGSLAATARPVQIANRTVNFGGAGQIAVTTTASLLRWLDEPFFYNDGPSWGTKLSMWPNSTGRLANGAPYMRAVTGTWSKFAEYATANFVGLQDDMFAEWTHKTAGLLYGVAEDNEIVISLRSNSATVQTSTTGVWLVIRTSQVFMSRLIAGTETMQSANPSYAVPYGTRLRFEAVGDLYSIFRLDTGELLCQWGDYDKLSERGDQRRRFVMALTGNRPFAQQQYQSPTMDDLIWGPAEPPSLPPLPVQWQATGPGSYDHGTSETWTHTVAPGGKAIVVGVCYWGSSSNPAVTATCAGVAMTELGKLYYGQSGSNYAVVLLFGVLNPPSGTPTISVSLPGSVYSICNSVSYYNVSGFGNVSKRAVTSPSSVYTSLAAYSAPGQMVANVFGGWTQMGSAYNHKSRWYKMYQSNVNLTFRMGDAIGADRIAFQDVLGDEVSWGSIAVPLLP